MIDASFYPSEWLGERYPLERLPETMHCGMPLLEIDAIAALDPVILENATARKRMRRSIYYHKGMLQTAP